MVFILLFVGIEPTGTMFKPLTTCKFAVKKKKNFDY